MRTRLPPPGSSRFSIPGRVGGAGDPGPERPVLPDDPPREPARIDPLDPAEQGEHYRRGETERGLVEQEQARLRHERTPDRGHLLLAPGERARRLLEPLAQDGKDLADPIQRSCAPRPRRPPLASE